MAVLSAVGVWLVLGATIPVEQVLINVRWRPDVGSDARVSLERTLHLSQGEFREGSTWTYLLDDTSSSAIEVLVRHPSIEDTSNLDRAAFRPLVSPRETLIRRASLCTGALVFVLAWLWTSRTAQRAIVVPEAVLAALAGVVPVLLLVAVAATLLLAAGGFEFFWQPQPASSLVEAAYAGDRVTGDRLIRQGADPAASERLRMDGKEVEVTPLEAAVLSGDWQMVQTLVNAGASIDDGNRRRLACLAEATAAREVLRFVPDLRQVDPVDCSSERIPGR